MKICYRPTIDRKHLSRFPQIFYSAIIHLIRQKNKNNKYKKIHYLQEKKQLEIEEF